MSKIPGPKKPEIAKSKNNLEEGERSNPSLSNNGSRPITNAPLNAIHPKVDHYQLKNQTDHRMMLNSYGLKLYPGINKIYGEGYNGEDTAGCYEGYLKCCGMIPRTVCLACASCECGPLISVPQGFIGLTMEFGKLTGKVGPGLHTYNSCAEEVMLVDIRIRVKPIPPQELVTKDNITITIDSFLLYKIIIPELAVFGVQDYDSFIMYMTMATLKSVISENTLNEVLEKEDELEGLIHKMIHDKCDDYGIEVQAIEIKRISLAPRMINAMSTIALSQQERIGQMNQAKGDFESAKVFREAADELSKNTISLQLHYFEALREISKEKTDVLIMPGPLIDFFM